MRFSADSTIRNPADVIVSFRSRLCRCWSWVYIIGMSGETRRKAGWFESRTLNSYAVVLDGFVLGEGQRGFSGPISITKGPNGA